MPCPVCSVKPSDKLLTDLRNLERSYGNMRVHNVEVIKAAIAEIKNLKREHEFICRKCGKRQDNPNQKNGDFYDEHG